MSFWSAEQRGRDKQGYYLPPVNRQIRQGGSGCLLLRSDRSEVLGKVCGNGGATLSHVVL